MILNWNRWSTTRACVNALARIELKGKHVLIVDNGSDVPPTPQEAAELGADGFVQTGTNLGYAGGNNAGIRYALDRGAEFVWILNNDTIAEPTALGALLEVAAADPAIGALTSNVSAPDGRVESDVAFAGSSRNAPWDYFGRVETVQCTSCDRLFHPSRTVRGPSLFFRAAALREVGFLDERYFHYYEEMDLVERISDAGWTVGLACGALVSHASGTTLPAKSGQSIYYLFRNFLLFRRKFYGESIFSIFLRHPLQLPRYVVASRHTLRGEFRPLRAHVLALFDGARGRGGHRPLGPSFEEPLPFVD